MLDKCSAVVVFSLSTTLRCRCYYYSIKQMRRLRLQEVLVPGESVSSAGLLYAKCMWSSGPSTAVPWEMLQVQPLGGLQASRGPRGTPHPPRPAFFGLIPQLLPHEQHAVCILHRVLLLPPPHPLRHFSQNRGPGWPLSLAPLTVAWQSEAGLAASGEGPPGGGHSASSSGLRHCGLPPDRGPEHPGAW